jgi:hypothetical protein
MSSTNNPSVFIPRAFVNITKQRIAETFDKLDLGIVEKIDFVRKNGRNGAYNSVYIHLKYWLKSDASRQFRDRLYNSQEGAKLVYDDPWFWIVLPNTSVKPDNKNAKKEPAPAPAQAQAQAQAPGKQEKILKPRILQRPASVSAPPELNRSSSIAFPPVSSSAQKLKDLLKKPKALNLPTTPPSSPPPSSPVVNEVCPDAPIKLTPENISLENMQAALDFVEELYASFPQEGSPRSSTNIE